jgi:hypothetical protein
MKTIDLHGERLKIAEDMFMNLLNNTRLSKTSEEVCFVTGQGVIREHFVKLAQQYELDIQQLDPGRLWITFE